MPVPSSSRRKVFSRKQPSSDHIEEDIVSQKRGQEDVDDDDEDEQPRRSVKKSVKKEQKPTVTKGKGKGRAIPVVDEEEEADYDHVESNDLGDQPLIKGDATKLRGLAHDWSSIRKSIHQPSFNQLRDIAITVADTAEGEDNQKCLADLDNIMRELIDIDEEMLAHEQIVDELYQNLVQGEQITDALERYNNGIGAKTVEYKKKTSRQKYAKNEAYVAFRQGIHEVHHPDEAMPPVTGFIPKEDGDNSDDDDDVEVGGVTQDYKCPLTLTTLVDPMTAPCGHSFSGEAIKAFFRDSTNKKCPGAGCNRVYSLANLKPDKELAKKIKRIARRAQQSDGESDGDEVIE